MKYLPLPLLLLACDPRTDGRNDCATRCGSLVVGTLDSCADVSLAEDEVLAAYAPVVPPARLCSVLRDSTVTFEPGTASGRWVDPKLGPVDGLAYRFSKTVVLADVAIAGSAYPHEVGHLLDYDLGIGGNADHYEWEARGYYAAHRRFWDAFGVRKGAR